MQLQSGEATQKSVQDTFEEVQRLDNQLNEIMSGCFQIREREVKKELLHVVQECKERTKAATNILRELAFTGEKLSNVHIAQLNNLAYKGVMKSGLQKKLDERAIKNQEFYKKLDDQVAKAKTGMDFKDLREKHGALVDQLGCCPLSCADVFEAMEAGDCFCLGLQVRRPESAIADPSKLQILDIVPTFMQSESFLDSATFKISKNDQAHGGFNGKGTNEEEADLAMGLGREKITGVIPIYLFKEHWEIARRRAPPIYGFSVHP